MAIYHCQYCKKVIDLYYHPACHKKSQKEFIKHLERVSKQVAKWPAWKRNMLGPVTPEDMAAARKEMEEPNQ